MFGGGVSLVLTGMGLFARSLLARGDMSPALRDRIVFTVTGIAILVFWALPPGTIDRLLEDVELRGDFDIMFVSGIAMVGAAVWTVMYNADLILRGLQIVTGRLRQFRPVLVTAVAYPLSSKFRTGLTLTMFALVIFTLTVMSILTDTFGTQFVETRVATGGWDLEGSVNFTTPIDDIRSEMEKVEDIDLSRIEAIGGYTTIPMQVREVEADDQEWRRLRFVAADDGYLESSSYDLKLIADGFGTTPEEAFEAMRNDPSLAVIGGSLLSDTQGEQGQVIGRVFQGVNYDDESMSPVEIEIREPTTRTVTPLKIIGVVDRVHDTGFGLGMIGSKDAIDELAPFPVPITTYRFRVTDLEESKDLARSIERSFLGNGMQTVVLEDFLNEQLGALRGFFRLFTGFMALGLFVGIAALGVVSTRAVVERRQQIGMLRAVGIPPGHDPAQLPDRVELRRRPGHRHRHGPGTGAVLQRRPRHPGRVRRRHDPVRDSLGTDGSHPGADVRLLPAGDLHSGAAGIEGIPGGGAEVRVGRVHGAGRRTRRRRSHFCQQPGWPRLPQQSAP